MTPGEYEGMLFRLRQIGENDAADEIERLRAQRDKWCKAYQDAINAALGQERGMDPREFSERIDQLRTKLEG